MAAKICPHCGGSNPPSASYCQFCGSALPGPAGAPGGPPLPGGATSGTPPYGGAPPYAAPYGQTSYAPPPPTAPQARRRRQLWLVLMIVGLVIVVSVLGYLYFAAPIVSVTGINIVSPDNVCNLSGSTAYGFNTTAGSPYSLTLQIPNNSSTACMISTVTTTTVGFSISGANLPLVIPANTSQLLSFNVNVPSSSWTGVLTLVFT